MSRRARAPQKSSRRHESRVGEGRPVSHEEHTAPTSRSRPPGPSRTPGCFRGSSPCRARSRFSRRWAHDPSRARTAKTFPSPWSRVGKGDQCHTRSRLKAGSGFCNRLETPLKDRLILPKKKGLNMSTIAQLTGLVSTPNTAESGKADLQKQFKASLTPQLGSLPSDNTTPRSESGSHKHRKHHGTNDTQVK